MTETTPSKKGGPWWRYFRKALMFLFLALGVGIFIITVGTGTLDILWTAFSFAAGFLLIVFVAIVLLAVVIQMTVGRRERRVGGTTEREIGAPEQGIIRKTIGGMQSLFKKGEQFTVLILWFVAMISMWLLFPKAFGEWLAHWNIFLVSQIVAIMAILFLPVWATRVAMAGAIAVMLWSALDSTFWTEKEKPKEVARVSTTGKFCWYETEKGTGWRKDVKNETGCFSGKILEHDKTHLLVKYTTKGGYGICDWDKLKDPQYGEWKEVGRNNGGNCMLTQVSKDLFTGWFESHYDTKGRYIPGYRDKYYVELRLN